MTDDLEVQVRELVQDADWRSNMYPERLISALAAWARRLVTENARDAVSATVDQFAAALNAIAPRPNQWRQMWPPEDVLRRLVAETRAWALREAKTAIVKTSSYSESLTLGPASRILCLSQEATRRLAAAGVLPATRTSTGWRLFRREDVERLAAERAQRLGETQATRR